MLRPLGCDGDDCDRDETGRWRHLPGCLALTGEPDEDEAECWPDAYLDGYGGPARAGRTGAAA